MWKILGSSSSGFLLDYIGHGGVQFLAPSRELAPVVASAAAGGCGKGEPSLFAGTERGRFPSLFARTRMVADQHVAAVRCLLCFLVAFPQALESFHHAGLALPCVSDAQFFTRSPMPSTSPRCAPLGAGVSVRRSEKAPYFSDMSTRNLRRGGQYAHPAGGGPHSKEHGSEGEEGDAEHIILRRGHVESGPSWLDSIGSDFPQGVGSSDGPAELLKKCLLERGLDLMPYGEDCLGTKNNQPESCAMPCSAVLYLFFLCMQRHVCYLRSALSPDFLQ